MKKLKYFAVLILALTMLVFASACTRTTPLATPVNFVIDDSLTLYWKFVPSARVYDVSIEGVDSKYEETISSHVTHVSLAHLAEGDYEIRVMALGGSNNEVTSKWSEKVEFHRNRESGLLYSQINGNTEYSITGIGTATGDIVIEDTFRGKPVTVVATDAFRGKGNSRITSVVLPEGIRSIGSSAFYNCTNLVSVVLPDTVRSVGDKLFQGCNKLASVKLPASLTRISDYMFAYCRALESIELPETVATIGESAFYNCSALASVTLPDALTYIGPHAFDSDTALASVSLGSGLNTVDELAFYNCTGLTELNFQPTGSLVLAMGAFEKCSALTSVELPEGLTTVGDFSFYECASLENVTIPESVTSVGSYVFFNAAFYNAQAEEGGFIYADDWLVDLEFTFKATVENIRPEDIREDTVGIADQTFIVELEDDRGNPIVTGAPSLVSVELAKSIRYIGINAFYRCTALDSFVAEEGSLLETVADNAFQGCTSLRIVRFREGLKDIGSYAFYNCTFLKNPDYSATEGNLVPGTVTRVGTYAFMNTGLWTDAADSDGVVYASNWVVGFNSKTTANHTNISFLATVEGVADFAFYKNEELVSIVNLNQARHIGRGAFFDCTALTTVTLSDDLKEIADNTFSGCTALIRVNFPTDLNRIGMRAFYECNQITEIDLSETNVKEIGDYAFYDCFNVKEISLGTAETIGDYAFYGLNQIAELELPESLVSIGSNAFAGCELLETVTFGGSLEVIGPGAFQGCTALRAIDVPDSVTEIGGYAFYRCTSLSDAELGANVASIGSYAFGQTSISSIVLPASLKSVSSYAFKNCTMLTSVLFMGVPDSIGAHAFYGSPRISFFIAGDPDALDEKSWSTRWNSSYRPVVWNVTVSDEGYVTSFTVETKNVSNPFARYGLHGPARKGYRCIGWALTEGGELVYGVDEWRDADMGTTLYPVWEEAVQLASQTEAQPQSPTA